MCVCWQSQTRRRVRNPRQRDATQHVSALEAHANPYDVTLPANGYVKVQCRRKPHCAPRQRISSPGLLNNPQLPWFAQLSLPFGAAHACSFYDPEHQLFSVLGNLFDSQVLVHLNENSASRIVSAAALAYASAAALACAIVIASAGSGTASPCWW